MHHNHAISELKHFQRFHLLPNLHAIFEGHRVDELDRLRDDKWIERHYLIKVAQNAIKVDHDASISVLLLDLRVLLEEVQELGNDENLHEVAFFFVG